MDNLNCKKPVPCVPNEPEKEIYPPATEPFNACVGDYTLQWDGVRLHHERNRTTPDGTYTAITVVNGCITAYGYADEAVYTPPYCNPTPSSCQDGNGSGGGDVVVSPNTNNSLQHTVSGLFARTYLSAGDNVTITGTGVQNNPYSISIAAPTSQGEVKTVAGIQGINAVTDGLGNTTVSLEPTGVTGGTYRGFTIDEAGRITALSPTILDGRDEVEAGAGLTAVNDGEVITIAHPTFDLPDAVVLGGYVVGLNDSGHIIELERTATVTAGTYKMGVYNVAIDEFGTIQDVQQNTAVVDAAGVFTTKDNKLVTYDETGRITDVEEADPSTAVASAPLPLRDLYKFTVDYATTDTTVKKEVYGADITPTNVNTNTFSLPLPGYVSQPTQIFVHGAVTYTVDTTTNLLVITHNTVTSDLDTLADRIVTVSFRG